MTPLPHVDTAPAPDPWSGWAEIYELPASVEYDTADETVAEPPTPASDLETAVAQLAAALADERTRRSAAEDAVAQAQAAAHAAEVEAARLGAELAAGRNRVHQLERDRDDVIRRAEELLTAVRERADQRLAAEREGLHRHWSELLVEERRRVEVLDGERAALLKRLEDAWMAGAGRARARPLRPLPVSDADDETAVTDLLPEQAEIPEGESPELTAEIEHLRERLRVRLRKPPDMPAVEAGVDRLRESRLAREKEGRRRRR